jgi:iron complex outermembrane recepter protein
MATKKLACLLTGVALIACSPAFAQEAPQAETEQDSGALDDIVVVAQRQTQNLQETPVSVAAFTGDTLAERGVYDVRDLAAQTPSFNLKTDFGVANPNIYIRGVGIGDFNANVTGAAGVYIDEVYMSAAAGQLLQFYDVERVEVLRGPQGTLYGRNTTAGAVNIFSRRPGNNFGADLRLSYGRFNDIQAEGGVDIPIAPGVINTRISANFRQRDGYIRNLYTGGGPNPANGSNRLADIDTWAVRGQVDIRPSESFSILINGHYGESDTTGVRFVNRGLLDPQAFAVGQLVPCNIGQLDTGTCVNALGYASGTSSPDEVRYNNPTGEFVSSWGVNGRAVLELGDYTLTSITAYERTKRNSFFDGDESPLNIVDAVHRPSYRQFTQELRLASPTSGQRFRWTAGGFYFQENLDFAGTFDVFRQVRPAIAAAAAPLVLPPELQGLYLGFNPAGSPDLAAALGNPIFAYPTLSPLYAYDQRVESWAVFGQAYYDLTDQLTVTLGLRYSEEQRRFNYSTRLVEPFLPPEGILLTENSAALGNNRTSFDDMSFRAALEYRANDDLFFFGSVSRGAKSGGFNGAVLTSQAQTQPFDDEQITAYELGIRSEWLDRRLRFNVTGFYYDYKDLQLFTLTNVGGLPQQVLANAPGARVYGAEFELLARPAPNFTIGAGMSLLNSRINRDFIGGNGVNQRGNQLAFSPPVTLTGNAEWAIPMGSNELVLQSDFTLSDRSYTDTTNTPRLRTDNGFTVNGRIAYRFNDGDFEIAAWGKNIFDERYVTFVANISDFGFDRVQYSEPATYGVSVRARF